MLDFRRGAEHAPGLIRQLLQVCHFQPHPTCCMKMGNVDRMPLRGPRPSPARRDLISLSAKDIPVAIIKVCPKSWFPCQRNSWQNSMLKHEGDPRAVARSSPAQRAANYRLVNPSKSKLQSRDRNFAFGTQAPLKRQTSSAMNATRTGDPTPDRHVRADQVVS